MDTLMQDIRFALRTLAKAPMFTTLCVLCLAIGIGLNSNIYSAVYAVFQRPFPYADPERLVAIEERNVKRGFDNQSMPFEMFQDLQQQTTAFDGMAASSFRSINITDGDEPVRLQGELISWNLFPMLGVRPHLGRVFRPDEDAPGAPGAIIVGYGVWEKRYGADSSIIGRSLPVNGAPHTVVGVMPRGFMFPEREEAWVPITPRLDGRPRDIHEVQVFGRLKSTADVGTASSQLNAVSERLAKQFPEAHGNWRALAKPIRDTFIDKETKLVIAAMMGAVTFVLLIACANVANLLLARATSRGREIAVRAALGAGRGRIVRQLLTESILLALIACPIGIGIAYWLLDIIIASIPEGDLPYYFVFEINGPVLLYTVVIAVLTGVVFGLAPALQAARGNLQTALKDGGRGSGTGGPRQRFRTALAIGEIALSLVLLVGAALFVRSFLNLQTKSGGIETANLMTMRFFLPGERYDSANVLSTRVEDVIQRIEALPGVVSATASNQIPLGGGGGGAQLEIEGKPIANRADAPFVGWTGVTAHWFGTLGIPLLSGRPLDEAEARTKSPVAIINESMGKQFWPDGDALGRRFKLVGDTTNTWFAIIGVSRDYETGPLDDPGPIGPNFVASYRHLPTRNTGLMIRTVGEPAQITRSARNAIRQSDPTMPVFTVASMEEVRKLGFWSQRLFGWMFAMFGIVALVLASVGVYGVISYGVTQRTQEIGVRVALGAQPADVIRLVVRNGAILALAGIAIGLVGAFGLTRVIQSLLTDVSSTDPLSFIGVTLFLGAVALFASYVPARRATRVDPLTALRSE
jgi:putative ABC transport system permease protein